MAGGNKLGSKRGPYKRAQEKREKAEEKSIQGDGMSYQDIAKVLGISILEVKKIERSALKKLSVPNPKNKRMRDYHNIDLDQSHLGE